VKDLHGVLVFGTQTVPYDIERKGPAATVRIGDGEVFLNVHPVTPGLLTVTCNGQSMQVHWATDGPRTLLHVEGQTYEFQSGRAGPGEVRAQVTQGDLRAPMPGVVTRMLVQLGQTVNAGDPLCVVEAMKMEHLVRAVRPGRVTRITDPGTQVESGAVVVEVEEPVEGADER
jgi:biotin carboxyl carrier protein